jgi:hypothetical protein
MGEAVTDEPRNLSKRIKLEFSPDAVERLNRIKGQTGASTYAELIRDALRLYEWFVEQERDGCEIGIVRSDVLVKVVKFVF